MAATSVPTVVELRISGRLCLNSIKGRIIFRPDPALKATVVLLLLALERATASA